MVLRKGQQLPPYVGAVPNLAQIAAPPNTATLTPNLPHGNMPINTGSKGGTDARKKKEPKKRKKINVVF